MSTVTLERLDRELGKRWFERRSPLLDTAFKARHAQASRREMSHACLLVGLLYIAFAAMDALLIPDMLPYTMLMRLGIGGVYVIAVRMQVRYGIEARQLEFQCALGVFLGFAAWLCVASMSADTGVVLYYVGYGLIFMLVANLFFSLSFEFALLSSGLITLTFLVWLVSTRVNLHYAICFGSLYVLSFILTVFLNFKFNRERYRVYLNACRADLRQREVVLHGQELFRLSTTDALTELSNRRAIDGVLQKLWADAQQSGKSFGVVLIDVDHFKLYNDRYGHQQGDRCLAAVARAMRALAEPRGYALGRFGGEEFAALFPAASTQEVMAFADDVREIIEDLAIPHAARRDRVSVVTVSVGAAFSRDFAGDKPERSVTAADLALYVAKEEGRNCVRSFDPRMLEAGGGDELTAEMLRSSVLEGRISAAFQPIVDVTSGRIWAVEALMRMRDRQGRAIPPDVFIPVAERTGTILPLGEWILREACDVLASQPTLPVISVNVSGRQIDDPDFVRTVEAIVRDAGIAPSRLALEITEGGQISGNPKVAAFMERLGAIGIRVWLDDFGTGFAGLTCLSTLRFDMVKIDRFFVQSCNTPRGAKLLKNIIDLVDNCAQRTIVEGVEEASQIELVSSFGVDLFQGYHLGRPMLRAELACRLDPASGSAEPLAATAMRMAS